MNQSEFYDILEGNYPLKTVVTEEIQELVEKYPFIHTGSYSSRLKLPIIKDQNKKPSENIPKKITTSKK